MLQVLVTITHVLVCLVLIGVVLLQTGKRADLAGAFGGGSSQTAFGARGAATFLSKATTGFAIAFMFTSIALSLLPARGGSQGSGSVLDDVAPLPAAEAPAAVEPQPAGQGATEGEGESLTPDSSPDAPATDGSAGVTGADGTSSNGEDAGQESDPANDL